MKGTLKARRMGTRKARRTATPKERMKDIVLRKPLLSLNHSNVRVKLLKLPPIILR